LIGLGALLILILLAFIRYLKPGDKIWVVNNNVKVVFAGDSHIEQAINNTRNNSIFNLAQSGDNYLYTYTKLKRFLSVNKSIETVILGFDLHNIDSSAIEWYTSKSYLNYKFSKLFPYIENDDLVFMLKLNGLNSVRNIPNMVSHKNILYKKLFDFGSFVESFKKMDSTDCFEKPKQIKHVSRIQLRYIDKIIELANKTKVNLLFLTIPIHNSQKGQYNKSINLKSIADNRNIVYLDFGSFKLENDCFADIYHLNNKGAIIFTDSICKFLKHENILKD